MKLGDMYPAVLTLGLIAILIGVVLTILGTLGGQTSLTTAASTAVNDSATAITGFVTWFGIIITILAAGVVIFIVMKSFQGR